MAVLVHEKALLPRRLELGLVLSEPLEREEAGQVLVHCVDRALLQAGARLPRETGQRGQAQAEPPVALSPHEQHQLAEEIVHEPVGGIAPVPHEVDRGDAGPHVGHLVRERDEPARRIPRDHERLPRQVATIEPPEGEGPFTAARQREPFA